MTWLERIPDVLLKRGDTKPLLAWLDARGYRLSLEDLDRERRRRGITPPINASRRTRNDR